MIYIIVLGVIFILIFILIFLFILNFSKLKRINIKINEAENNIDMLLTEKYIILSKLDKSIKNKTETDFFDGLYNTNIEDLNSFDLNKLLSKYDNAIIELSNYNNNLEYSEDDLTDFNRLNDVNINRLAAEKFYNDNVVIYNKLINKFPINIISKIKGYDKKELFTNEKEEIFEILKN